MVRTTTWRERLYFGSPPAIQSALLNLHALSVQRHRYGRPYRDRLDWLISRERASPEQSREYQDDRVREMVALAARQSPYYLRLFREHGIDPTSIRGVGDISAIPLTTKAQVRSHWADFLTSAPRGDWLKGVTSGTTGTPLTLWYDRDICVLNNAVDGRNKTWAGARADDWFGILLGRIVLDPRRNTPPFWVVNHVQRQVWYSSFHLRPEHIETIVEDIRRRRLRFLEGYPSTLHEIAKCVLASGVALPLTAAITSSETLHDIQRQDIELAFGCPLFDFYASAERVIFAAECNQHDGKHLVEEFGYVEVVDGDGTPLPPGREGFLVGTSLHNTAMPLLRYLMSDVTHIRAAPCACGRAGRIMAPVATKAEDLVITPSGRVVAPASLTHPFKTVRGVSRSQLIQDRPDHVLLRVIPEAEFTHEEQELLVGRLRDRIGDDVVIEVQRVDDLPREPSGKFRWIISHVPTARLSSSGGA